MNKTLQDQVFKVGKHLDIDFRDNALSYIMGADGAINLKKFEKEIDKFIENKYDSDKSFSRQKGDVFVEMLSKILEKHDSVGLQANDLETVLAEIAVVYKKAGRITEVKNARCARPN